MTLPEMLAQIVEQAQAEVECPCPCHGISGPLHYHLAAAPCPTCQGPGKVPDPRFVGLGEVLTEPAAEGYVGDAKYFMRPFWNRMVYPQGALNGALLQWASCLWKESIPASEELSLLVVSLSQCFGRSDCDDRATERVLEYVEKAREATHAAES